jgi:sulfur relay (sulfurtransferase) DsrC/TusE family protein
MRKELLLLASASVLFTATSTMASDETKKITTQEWEVVKAIRDSKKPLFLKESETNLIKKMREEEQKQLRAQEEQRQMELLKKAFKMQLEIDKKKEVKKVDMPLTKEEVLLLESMRTSGKGI